MSKLNDKKEIEQAGAKERRARKVELADIRLVMDQPFGRRFLWKQLSACKIYETSFSTHSNTMSYNEGRRGAGLHLLGEILEADPDSYLKMINENRDKPEN